MCILSFHRIKCLRDLPLYCLVIAFILIAFYAYGNMNHIWGMSWNFWTFIYCVKTVIEVVASLFTIFYFFVAIHYTPARSYSNSLSHSGNYPNVLIVYLCCDDANEQALESILTAYATSPIAIWIHDDSTTEQARFDVDEMVRRFRNTYQQDISVLRRSNRSGGKPSAINNVIDNLPSAIEYLLLCDSDSFFPASDFLEIPMNYFSDPRVALVQFRNIGQVLPEDTPSYRVLAKSVDFYDTFVSFMNRFGWSPFLGHNAILRVSAIKEVGRFTPGQLADDIDLSVKLRLHGYHIQYIRDVACGERHPITYEALRLRTFKWTYGCTQILLRWGTRVLLSGKVNFLDKLTFFLTVGYYHFQILLLAYLTILCVLMPFRDHHIGSDGGLLFSSLLILLLMFLPSITYFVREKIFRSWPSTAICWGVTYGSQDFVMLHGLLRCLCGQKVGWVPTNRHVVRLKSQHFLPELLFGTLIIAVAITQDSNLLVLPTTVFFAGKFLITPFLNPLLFSNSSYAARSTVPKPRQKRLEISKGKITMQTLRFSKQFLTALPLLVIGVLTVSLTAGASHKFELNSAQEGSLTATSIPSDKPLQIELWHIQGSGGGPIYIQHSIERFEHDYPNIQVTVRLFQNDPYKVAIKEALKTDNPPCIFPTWGGGPLEEYIQAGQVLNITQWMEQDNYRNRFADAAIRNVTFDNKLWGVPVENSSVAVIFYNEKIFSDYNLTPPSTYDELLQIIDTLHTAGIAPFALANKTKWPGSMHYMYLVDRLGGPEIFRKAAARSGGSFEDPVFIKAGIMLQEMVRRGAFVPDFDTINHDDGESRRLLYSGQAAMELMGSWNIPLIKDENPSFFEYDLGFFPYPAIKDGKGNPDDVLGIVGDQFYHVSTGCQHPVEAFRMIQYLIDAQAVQERTAYDRIPPIKGFTTDATTVATVTRSYPIFVDSFAKDYNLNVNTSEGLTNWVTVKSGEMCMTYPSGQSWGAVFITFGKSKNPPRPGVDLSAYQSLSVDLRGQTANELVYVGLKDNQSPDDGSETKIPVSILTTDWQNFTFPLSMFSNIDLKKLYIPIEFVFSVPATICARNIQYLPPTADPMMKSVLNILEKAPSIQVWYDQYLPSELGELYNDLTQQLLDLIITPEQAAKTMEQAARNYYGK